MADLWHQFGADLTVGPTGDLALVSSPMLTQQRVLRRLLTNPLDYIWHVSYGAGLGQFVGQPAAEPQIQGAILGQIFNEVAVARSPEPAIEVSSDPTGTVAVQLRYSDADTGATQLLSFSVGGG